MTKAWPCAILRANKRVHVKQVPLILWLGLTSVGPIVGKQRWMESRENRVNRSSEGELWPRRTNWNLHLPLITTGPPTSGCGWTARKEADVPLHRASCKPGQDLETLKEAVWQDLEELRAQPLPHCKVNRPVSSMCGLHQHGEYKKVVVSRVPSKFMQNVTCDPC